MSDPTREALANILMDLRMDGPAADGWTYQQTMRHYADRILAALSTPPPSLDIDRLARAIRIVTERPVTLGHEADTEMDEADWLANAYAREYAALEGLPVRSSRPPRRPRRSTP